MSVNNDFSKGSVSGNILSLALPMTLAQLINVLYNVVDRIYIGHIPGESTVPLTGLGLALPIITIITAFANLFGMGGAPLCSIARGQRENKKAEQIMGNSFSMLLISGILLMILCLLFKKPLLYLFGASSATFPYADSYLTIYLLGAVFVMISLGMNSFINSQGFGKIGMMTVLLGAVANIILDPLFIFVFQMGVRGAAAATLISQMLSAVWVQMCIRDSNGAGFTREAVENLYRQIRNQNDDFNDNIESLGIGGYGLTNVILRLKLSYGLEVHFRIDQVTEAGEAYCMVEIGGRIGD